MRFVNPIIFVRDIATSKAFYTDIIGLDVEQDHGDFVLFEGHFAIHDGAALIGTVWGAAEAGDDAAFGRRNLLLYFEDEDIEGCFARLRDRVRLIHPLQRQPWGQHVFRFYDPDGHAVEVGEPLT
ncbi:MAG: VOC family protein [Bauldia sp.]|nr:VOC family protein [Bauldia sp.]